MTLLKKSWALPYLLGLILALAATALPLKWVFLLAAGLVFVFCYPLVLKVVPYVPALYLFIDYLLRKFSAFQGIASIWDELLFITMLGILFIELVRTGGRFAYRHTALDIPVALYVIIGLTHVLIVKPELAIAIEGFRAVFQHVLWYFIMTQFIRTQTQARTILKIFVYTGLFLGLHAVYQYAVGVEMPGNWVDTTENVRTRAFSIIGSPNILGSLFVLFVPMGVAMTMLQQDLKAKLYYGGITLIMGLGLLFTLSRGAWLALAGGLFFAALLLNRKLVIHLSALGGIVILAGGSLVERLLYIFSPTYLFKSASGGRLYRWKEGLTAWSESKVFGLGLGRYGGAVALNNKLSPFYLDNYYVKTLVEMGIFGFAALILMLLTLAGYATSVVLKQRNAINKLITIGFTSAIVGIILHNAVENIFEVPVMIVYFWTTAAALTVFASPTGEA